MFFGQAIRLYLGGLTATHPPLALRIRAIEPSWDGEFLTGAPAGETTAAAEGSVGFAATAPAHAGEAASAGDSHGARDGIAARVGNPTHASLAQAQVLIGGLPTRCVDAAHDPFSARALVYAVLLPEETAAADQQRAALAAVAEPEVITHLAELKSNTAGLDDMQRLTLVSMAVPALKMLSRPQYVRFVADVIALIRADERIDLFEWVLHRVLLKALKPHFEGAAPVSIRYRDLDTLRPQVAQVLSAITRAGAGDAAAQQRAFAAGTAAVSLDLHFDAAQDPNLTRLNDALRELRAVHPLAKPRLIKGCAACALTDGATSDERALLVGIAATIDCPLPPDLTL